MQAGRIGLVVLVLLAALLPAAGRLTLDQARKQGLVGERPDGTVGIVVEEPADELEALVLHVNQKRRETYAAIAAKTGAPPEAVAARAGARLISERPAGEWVADAKGVWHQKQRRPSPGNGDPAARQP